MEFGDVCCSKQFIASANLHPFVRLGEFAMRFNQTETALLRDLYFENDYPSDRLIRDSGALDAFTAEFNLRAGTNYDPETVAAELERVRKDKAHTGGLARLGRQFRGPRFLAKSA